jgi:hypothetical protein
VFTTETVTTGTASPSGTNGLNTRSDDGVVETLTEAKVGNAQRLTVTWKTDAFPSGWTYPVTVKLVVKGRKIPASGNSSPDNFNFNWATTSGSNCGTFTTTNPVVVSATTSTAYYSTVTLSLANSNPVCIQATDSITSSDTKADSLELDYLAFFKPGTSGAVCRAAADLCDIAESYDSNGHCPSDSLQPAGYLCRDVQGPCDAPDRCSGTSAACINDYSPAGTICDPSGATCSGSSANCLNGQGQSVGFIASNPACR